MTARLAFRIHGMHGQDETVTGLQDMSPTPFRQQLRIPVGDAR
jgi:hypothetical protein